MPSIDDKLYWFTKLGLQQESLSRVVPVKRSDGSTVIVVQIPKNSHDIQSGFYVAKMGRVGGLVPVEGPYRTRMIAAIAAVT